MEIIQKRFSNQATFFFGKDELKYTIKDSSGTQSFSVEYGSIPKDMNELEEQNPWYRNMGIFWVSIGTLQIAMRFFESGHLKGSMWITLGLPCLLLYMLAKTKYSVINTEDGRIFIIQNKQHDRILDELNKRRISQWRQWYADVNLSNESAKEIGKFEWLRDQNVISKDEYQDAVNTIYRQKLQPNTFPDDLDPSRTIN